MAKITFIARMTVKPGRDAEFVRYCRELEQYVRAHEPEVLAYEFFRLREPNRYAVIESFTDEASEHRHMTSSKLAELGPKIAACLVGEGLDHGIAVRLAQLEEHVGEHALLVGAHVVILGSA